MASTHVLGVNPTEGGKKIEEISIADLTAGGLGDGTVTNTKLANVPTGTIKGRDTAGTGPVEDLTPAEARTLLDVPTTATALNRANHTGTQDAGTTLTGLDELIDDRVSTLIVAGTNITKTYDDVANTLTLSAATASPGADSVTNDLLANMATSTIKGRSTAGTGDPEDLTPAQVRTIINVADGATANDTDANLKNRANHTGTQLASTISDLSEAVDDRVNTLIIAGSNITKTYDDVANTLTLSATAAASGNFTATGTNARTYPMNDKAAQFVSIEDFYRSDLGDTSYHQAANRALAAGKRDIYFPPRSTTYTWSSPVDVAAYDNVRFFGATSVFSDNEGAARISCPAGFVVNSDATAGSAARRRIEIRGLSLDGDGTAGSKCISGCFGGIFHELRISDFDVGIENPSSFLSDYDRIAFDGNGLIAISLADANGVSITRSWFSANWIKHISTLDVTPRTGSDNGMAIYLARNNHNASGNVATGNSLITISGNIFGTCNYFEAYPATTNWLGKFLDIKVNGFGNYGLTWINNEMNGGGSDGAQNAIYLNGTRTGTLPNDYGGIIMGNRLLGFNTTDRPAIAFGTNNCVTALRICDNFPVPTISNRHARSMYRPMVDASWTSTTNISGATFIALPIGSIQAVDNADAISSSTWTCRRSGMYKITTGATYTATSTFASAELELLVNGTQYRSLTIPVDASASASGTITAIANIAFGQTVQVRGRNGQNCTKGFFVCEWLGDGHQ